MQETFNVGISILSWRVDRQAKRCLALPFASSGTGWERKKDTSGKHSAMQMAFAFAAGDKAAGEVSPASILSKPFRQVADVLHASNDSCSSRESGQES